MAHQHHRRHQVCTYYHDADPTTNKARTTLSVDGIDYTQASSDGDDNCNQLPETTTQPPAPSISDCDDVAITSGSHASLDGDGHSPSPIQRGRSLQAPARPTI